MPGKIAVNIVDELSTAYKTEIAGYGFYKAASEMIRDEKGREVLEGLARDELDHIKVISTIADSVKKGTGWMSYENALKSQVPGAGAGLPIFPATNDLIERFKTNQTDQNAVDIGIEIENQAVGFYTRLLEGAETPEEKVVLTSLLEMERSHLKILRWEAESINTTGFWCGQMEFSVEKETE